MTPKMLKRLFLRDRIIKRLRERYIASEIAEMFRLSSHRQIYGIEANARYWLKTELGQQVKAMTDSET